MFEKVLVPTDFSRYSQKILKCVNELPGLKEVVLLNVIGPADPLARVWDPGAQIKESEAKLAEQKKLLDGRGLNVKARHEAVMEVEVWKVIEKVADEEGCSVIVMGARGKGVVEGIFLGSVARKVLRYGDTNLLLMHYKMLEGRSGQNLEKSCSQLFSKVLCSTDLSESAENAIDFIKGIEGVGEIMLQYVVFGGETWREIDAHVEEATKRLNGIRECLDKAGLKVSIHVGVGSPAKEISSMAEKEDVSLIAMSSHGKDWLKQLNVGSTTYDVARMSDRPVLVVKEKNLNT